ncbi:hypothetical protein QQS21_011941 [Conoideocrella luteorostrata]|uniref:Uncharacterized protein n=1 Tax=Conoideocrella luteorostrata TaxID=1105319 RepID=A0AAJ0CC48_9HYPO|nr:hypothetical protein QQS21_011941 [Conoideocrella luteorostrata]
MVQYHREPTPLPDADEDQKGLCCVKSQVPKRPKAQEEETPIADLSPPATGTPRASRGREEGPRRARIRDALGSMQPAKATKASGNSAHTATGGAQGQPAQESSQRQSATGIVKTRYSRASRGPERWVPGH